MSSWGSWFAALLAAIAALIALILLLYSDFVLEFDEVRHFPAPVSHGSTTIEDVFSVALGMDMGRAGEKITVNPSIADPNDIGDLTLLDSAFCEKLIDERRINDMTQTKYREACLSMASLDNILAGSEDHRPFLPGRWYAHGLSAPCCEGVTRASDCGFEGLARMQDLAGKQVRERFLVMACEISMYSPEGKLHVSAHELGHVLNLHHCEYEYDTPLDLNTLKVKGKSLTHLRSHERREVMPGPTGAEWCELPDKAHTHPTSSCCGVEKAGSSENLPEGVALEIHPEKLAYLAGEPIRLRAVLRIDTGGVERLAPGGLHPYLGYLRVWTPDGEGEVRTFYPPFVATRSLGWEGEDGSVEESEIVDLSFMHPRPELALQVGATYSGLRLAGEDAAPLQVASATSVIPSVAPGAPGGAVDPFADEEARLFLFLLGGDHLTSGVEAMQEVAHAEGPLAPYADLALGVNLAVAFHRYDRATGTIVIRQPEFEQARQHLDRAQTGRPIFPFSYAIVLDQALARTYEGLGDSLRGDNPESSLELYRIAERHYEAVATLSSARFETVSGIAEAPLSPIERSAVDVSAARLASLMEKMEALRGAAEE